LGSIFEDDAGNCDRRAAFWASADRALDRLGLAAPQRARIVAALERKVPRPTDAERAAQEARDAAFEARRAAARAEQRPMERACDRALFAMRYRAAIEAERAARRGD
jgi:hypothetical protein